MEIRSCEPEVRRARVGWLAASPADHPYRIGVVGESREEAIERFIAALAAWGELHSRTPAPERSEDAEEPTRLSERESRDFAQRAFDVVRQATGRHDEDETGEDE